MPVSLPRLSIGLVMMVVTVLAIVGVATKQFDVEVQPSPLLPTFRCQVELYFFHRKTICPGQDTVVYRTPRDEGFFECVSAWDRFQAGFAFTILGIIFAGLSFMLFIGSAFVPARARVFSKWVLAGLATASAVFLTIAWPLVESLVSEGFCGHDFKGFRMSTFTLVIDPKKDYGHSLIIAAWCISVVGAIAALIFAWRSRKHGEVVKQTTPHHDHSLPVSNEPAATQRPVAVV